LGRGALFESLGIAVQAPPATHDGPVAGVSHGDTFLGWVLLADQVRPEAEMALGELRSLGLGRQIMVTGDRRAEAERVAERMGITEVRPEALPHEKMHFVLEEAKAGYRTMVVGDGINDALALKAGAVGVAMGAQGTDVALASADLVLMTNDLRRLATCVRLSRKSRRTIMINVGIGMGWTVIVVGVAAAGIFGASGALAAALMQNLGTVAVMANAGRLLKFQDQDAPVTAP
jgi:P-type E1-E2 ATPase